MNNEKNKFLTVSWLSGLLHVLSAEIFISTDATPDLWKQPFSAVRASGGYPGNGKWRLYTLLISVQPICCDIAPQYCIV